MSNIIAAIVGIAIAVYLIDMSWYGGRLSSAMGLIGSQVAARVR